MSYKTLVASCLVVGLAGCAQREVPIDAHMDHHDHAAMPAAAAIPAGVVDLENTRCVVTADAVGDSTWAEVYQGRVYHFCCADCPAEFKKDPAKFARAVAADPAKYGVKKELVN